MWYSHNITNGKHKQHLSLLHQDHAKKQFSVAKVSHSELQPHFGHQAVKFYSTRIKAVLLNTH